jgi:CRISPR-associated protein Cas5d
VCRYARGGASELKNSIEFKLWAKYALFTDPVTKIGGEKCSYQIPTYEALKGIVKSIYWKPTFIWVIDRVRVVNQIRTQTKGMKPLSFGGGNSLAIYTFLASVEYQVQAHFEWNMYRPKLEHDRVDGKHFQTAQRMLERGGRQDIFLGTRDCQGYVEPCVFGSGNGAYDDLPELAFGLMFHGFDYPDETGVNEFHSRFWHPKMENGIIQFLRPEECSIRKFVRAMHPKEFVQGGNFVGLQEEGLTE